MVSTTPMPRRAADGLEPRMAFTVAIKPTCGAAVADEHLITTRQQAMRYGAIAAVIIVLAVAALYLLGRGEAPAPATTAEKPAPSVDAKLAPSADDKTGPTNAQSDQLVSLIGEARRLANDGKFDE